MLVVTQKCSVSVRDCAWRVPRRTCNHTFGLVRKGISKLCRTHRRFLTGTFSTVLNIAGRGGRRMGAHFCSAAQPNTAQQPPRCYDESRPTNRRMSRIWTRTYIAAMRVQRVGAGRNMSLDMSPWGPNCQNVTLGVDLTEITDKMYWRPGSPHLPAQRQNRIPYSALRGRSCATSCRVSPCSLDDRAQHCYRSDIHTLTGAN